MGGYFFAFISLPILYPAQKQLNPKVKNAIVSAILIGIALLSEY